MIKNYSLIDRLCLEADQVLKTLFGKPATSGRDYPASKLSSDEFHSEKERKAATALMRVNHTGEVCAQALYHGQGLASRCRDLREKMQHAAIEEGDHLAWCSKRLVELGSHTSYLNPVWYTGAFVIGLAAGFAGDKWSLGFLAETENQVVAHLDRHLNHLLPSEDRRSQAIVHQMRQDETAHREEAIQAGAAELPAFIKAAMGFASRIMVKTAYWI